MSSRNTPQSIGQRRQHKREAIIEDILLIAREMMQADGVAALSFNAIARRLGVKPPSLYTYFDSKNAIYDALFRRGFEEFDRRMEVVRQMDASYDVIMTAAIESYMRFAQENPDLYQLMFQRPVPDFVPSEESMAVSLGALAKSRESMGRVLAANQLETGLPLDQAQDLVIALTHGLTELHLANNPELPVGQGRFGRLIPQAVSLIVQAWKKNS